MYTSRRMVFLTIVFSYFSTHFIAQQQACIQITVAIYTQARLFVPPYSVFCSISFRCGGLSIERNQKPLASEITLAVTHHDRQKQVEVKRSSRVNPHGIRLFSGCPYYFTLPMNGNNNTFSKQFRNPTEKSWSFGMNMYYIVPSKCTVKSCKKR